MKQSSHMIRHWYHLSRLWLNLWWKYYGEIISQNPSLNLLLSNVGENLGDIVNCIMHTIIQLGRGRVFREILWKIGMTIYIIWVRLTIPLYLSRSKNQD